MLDAAALDALGDGLAVPEPLFPIEAPGKPPEDRAKWPEEYRQRSFVAFLRKNCPHIIVASVANERKASVNYGARLKKLGLLPGMPDVFCLWDGGFAFCEFKGFRASGRPGELSTAQIEVGNRIYRIGHPVACFFTATAALDWLRGLGAPLPEGRTA